MSVSIQFFGVAGYKIITADGVHVLIDPFMDENPYSPVKSDDLGHVDLMLITHNAFDHFGDAGKILKKYKPKTICALDVQHNLVTNHDADTDLIRPTIWGMAMVECGVAVRPVESHHWSFAKSSDGQLLSGPAMGFIVDIGDGIRIYHPGDTALFSDMKLIGQLYKPTVGLMHVSLPSDKGVSMPHPECYKSGELTPQEALLASEWMGLDEVITSHYVNADCDDVKEFIKLVEENKKNGQYAPKTVVLAPGDVHKW